MKRWLINIMQSPILHMFFLSSQNTTVKLQRQAWINGFQVEVDLEYPAGLIHPLAHPGCGEEWQPTNHHHVCLFYMIKHMEGALNHPYLAWQTDSCNTPFTTLCVRWQEAFPIKKWRLMVLNKNMTITQNNNELKASFSEVSDLLVPSWSAVFSLHNKVWLGS